MINEKVMNKNHMIKEDPLVCHKWWYL